MDICKQVKDKVRTVAALEDMGVMDVVEGCGLGHPRTRRVWVGQDTKIEDVEKVLNSLGLKLKVVEI